jgi:hypothetical protein
LQDRRYEFFGMEKTSIKMELETLIKYDNKEGII